MKKPVKPVKVANPTALWQGDFGKEYTERNRVAWSNRVPFWRRIVESTETTSFLDIGCNAGWNMLALRTLRTDLSMSGCDINPRAIDEAESYGLDVIELPAERVASEFGDGACEMAITSGVLIHVPPRELERVMKAIVKVTSQYVMAIEYEAPEETAVEYRGHIGALWKRPYGELYKAMGLSLVEFGNAEGFDECTYWLLEK